MNKKSILLIAVLFCCFSLLYAQDNVILNAINNYKNKTKWEFQESFTS